MITCPTEMSYSALTKIQMGVNRVLVYTSRGQIKGPMKRLRIAVMEKLGHICLENLYNCRLQN